VSKIKPYPAYIESGANWLGEVPSDWQILPAKAVLSERKERSASADTHLTPSQTHGVLPQVEYMERTGNKVVLNLTGADAMRHVEPDDFISHLRSFQGGFEHSRQSGKVSAAYTVLTPRPAADPEYLRYLFKSSKYVQALQTTTDQLRDGQSIRFGQVALIPLPLPSLEEQRAISLYLDQETAEIDAFIADQEELIRLLTERRAATISHAVTKGLDAAVPLEDSGVHWLGNIPSHWSATKIRRVLLAIDQGVSPQAEGGLADDGSTGVLKAGCVNRGTFNELEHKRLDESFEFDEVIRVRVGDLIVNRASGSPDLVGSAARVRQLRYSLILSDKTFRLRPHRTIDSDFLELFLNSTPYRRQVLASISGAEGLANNLPMAALREMTLALPPLREQREIVGEVTRELADLDCAMADAREAMELSRERRAALISAAVTGKIDVREHAHIRS